MAQRFIVCGAAAHFYTATTSLWFVCGDVSSCYGGFPPLCTRLFFDGTGLCAGIALQAAALVWFYTRANSRAGSFLSLCTAAASVVANYSFIYFFVPFCMLYIYQNYLSNKDVLRSAIWLIVDVLFNASDHWGCIMNYRYIMHCSGDVTGQVLRS